jgi:hypothetical protein
MKELQFDLFVLPEDNDLDNFLIFFFNFNCFLVLNIMFS